MKAHHEILPSVIEALRFFGPMTPTQISAKLIERSEFIPAIDVAETCERESLTRPGGVALVKLADVPGNGAAGSLHRVYKV